MKKMIKKGLMAAAFFILLALAGFPWRSELRYPGGISKHYKGEALHNSMGTGIHLLNSSREETSSEDYGRAWHVMFYDDSQEKIIIFGGRDRSLNYLSDTWVWNGKNWSQFKGLGPSARIDHAVAYNSKQHKALLFGGKDSGGNFLGDTWEWDGEGWNKISSPGPTRRAGHAMAYDSTRGKVVLFGGEDEKKTLGDTWEWDGEEWSQVSSSGPSPRKFHTMALHATHDKVVLFGGLNEEGIKLGDTWEWDANTWKKHNVPGPSERIYSAMAYDSSRMKVALFGGFSEGVCSNDTWEWDGICWTQVSSDGPLGRIQHAMAYDCARGKVVLFGGFNFVLQGDSPQILNDTWEWDGRAWIEKEKRFIIEKVPEEKADLEAKKTEEEGEPEIVQCIEKLGGGNNIKTEDIRAAMETLDWYGDIAEDFLVEVFKNRDKGDVHNITRRLNSITVLGKIGNKRAIEPLKKLIEGEALNDKEKQIAEKSLARLEEQRILYQRANYVPEDIVIYAFGPRFSNYMKKSIDFLRRALEAYNWEVRLDALAALLNTEEKTETEPVIKLLKDEIEDVRLNAAAVLAMYKDKNSVEPLIKALQDESWAVRGNAVKALAAIGDSRAIEHIDRLKRDPKDYVRESAKKAINILKKKQRGK